MRTGSSVSIEVKPGSNHARPNTSAAKPTRIRGKPGIPRKPKRRSSLSIQLISRQHCAAESRSLGFARDGALGEKDAALQRAREARRENRAVRGLAHAG